MKRFWMGETKPFDVTTMPPLEKRVRDLLIRIAVEIRPCKTCGMQIYLVGHSNGKITPYTAEAINHLVNCPQAEEFR